MAEESDGSTAPLNRDFPPLDAVDSRWWYWIAAYPIVVLLFVPLTVAAAVLFFVPVAVVEPGPQPAPGPRTLTVLFGILLLLLTLAVVVLTILSVVLLPFALYLDARAVAQADVDWTPEPLFYGLLGVLQLVLTPLVGIVVAVYYLFRRHEHVGVP